MRGRARRLINVSTGPEEARIKPLQTVYTVSYIRRNAFTRMLPAEIFSLVPSLVTVKVTAPRPFIAPSFSSLHAISDETSYVTMVPNPFRYSLEPSNSFPYRREMCPSPVICAQLTDSENRRESILLNFFFLDNLKMTRRTLRIEKFAVSMKYVGKIGFTERVSNFNLKDFD